MIEIKEESKYISCIMGLKKKIKFLKERLHDPRYDHGYVHLKADDFEFMKKDRQIVKRLGETLELLVYPYLIESNTVKNILCIISGKKIQELELSKYNTSDILFIAKQLKKGILNEEEFQKILEVNNE